MEISIGDYSYFPDKLLGQGNFAKVYLGKSNKDPSLGNIAIKIIDYDKVEKKNKYSVNFQKNGRKRTFNRKS